MACVFVWFDQTPLADDLQTMSFLALLPIYFDQIIKSTYNHTNIVYSKINLLLSITSLLLIYTLRWIFHGEAISLLCDTSLTAGEHFGNL